MSKDPKDKSQIKTEDKSAIKDKQKVNSKKKSKQPAHLSKAYDPMKVVPVKTMEKDHSKLNIATKIAIYAMIGFTLLSFILAAVAALYQG